MVRVINGPSLPYADIFLCPEHISHVHFLSNVLKAISVCYL